MCHGDVAEDPSRVRDMTASFDHGVSVHANLEVACYSSLRLTSGIRVCRTHPFAKSRILLRGEQSLEEVIVAFAASPSIIFTCRYRAKKLDCIEHMKASV